MKEKMKQFIGLVTKSKKNIAITAGSALLVVALVGGGIYYAANVGGKDVQAAPVVKAEPKETAETKNEFTDKDVKDVVAGINDHYILQNAKDIDYNHKVSYDKKYVKDIKPDAKKVDLKKPGTYPVTYTVTVKTEALRTYLEEKKDSAEKKTDSSVKETADKEKNSNTANKDVQTSDNTDTKDTSDSDKKGTETDKKEDVSKDTEKKEDASIEEPKKDDTKAEDTKKEDTADSTKDDTSKDTPKEETTKPDTTKKEDTTDVVIDTEITVVEKDKAEDLANKGEVVWGDKNEPVEKEDGTKVEEKEETPETTPTPEKPATDTGKGGSADKGNSGSTDTGNGGSSGNGGGNSEPPAQAHTHNWVTQTTTVHHDATGHNETVVTGQQWVQDSAAWDEPVYEWRTICNKCGANCTDDPVSHSVDCGGGYSNKQVPTGETIRHKATGHYEDTTGTQWVQDSAAWEETVPNGDVCSSCGKTR